ARAGRLPRTREPRLEVLAYREPRGQCLGRPQPDLHLPADRGIRHGGSVMHMTKPTLFALALAFAGSIGTSHAQSRAATCFFTNDFEHEDALNGWDLGPAVERRTPEGEGLGEFVPAWTTGTAADANAEGYF